MDALSKKFFRYVIKTPTRTLKEWTQGLQGGIKPLKPNTLLYASTTIFLISLFARNIILIIASTAAVVIAWLNKEWEKGDWRKEPPQPTQNPPTQKDSPPHPEASSPPPSQTQD